MGKKSTPKAPPAPDYTGAAVAQGEANLDAARIGAELTNTNQVTPYGNQMFTKDPGSDQWTSTISLSPEQQRLYELQTQGDTALGETAVAQLNRVREQMGQPLDISNAPDRVSSVDPANYSMYSGSGPQYGNIGSGPTYQSLGSGPQYGQIGAGPQMQNVGQGPQAQTVGSGPQMQNVGTGPQMDRVGAGPEYGRYTADIAQLPDYAQQAQQVEDSIYRSASARLDPQFQQRESAERQRLINSGVAENSEAYRNAMDAFTRDRTAAYGDARDRAIQGRGAELSRMNNDFYTGNQQRYSQTMGALGFNNDASARELTDATNRAGFNNAAGQQEFANQVAGTGFNNAAGQQMYNNQVTGAGFNNTAGNNMYAQQLAGAGFNNAANQQGFANEANRTTANNAAAQQGFQDQAVSAGFNNAMQGQQFADAIRGLDFNNANTRQQFDDTMRSLGFNNSTQAQQFADAITGGNFQNMQRGAAIDEASYLRNEPLNTYNALATGAQVTNPQFRGTGQVQGPAAAPTFAGVQAGDQRAIDLYNAQLASSGSAQGGLFGMLGSLGGSFMNNGGLKMFGGG
jgi:hypothetical protein